MVGCVGNAPTLVRRTSALQAARALYAANNPGVKWWTATALHRALPLAKRATS